MLFVRKKIIIFCVFLGLLALLGLSANILSVYQFKFQKNLNNNQIFSQSEKLAQLKKQPVRKNFKPDSQHRIYVSLTTSPSRIQYIDQVLDTLEWEWVQSIFLVLPEYYARDGLTYTIPNDLLSRYPKLKIIRIPVDFGPITKLLPAIEILKQDNPDSEDILITIDDDMGYPRGMIRELARGAVQFNAVVGSAMGNKNLQLFFGKPLASKWTRFKNRISTYVYWQEWGVRKRNFIYGFGGVAYPVKYFTPTVISDLKTISQSNPDYFQSDDWVISYVLDRANVPFAKISNQYLNMNYILSLDWGEKSDALHLLSDTDARYLKCRLALNESAMNTTV